MKRFPSLACLGLSVFCFGAQAASLTDLGILPGYTVSGASAISADGKTVVGTSAKFVNNQNIVEPFVWTAAQGMVGIGWMPDCTNCVATSVSTNGVVVGYCAFPNTVTAFKWTAQSGYTPLKNPGQPETYATAISANGQIIVGYTGQSGAYQAAKWNEANQFFQLFPAGSQARDVSGDGSVIVGNLPVASYPYVSPVIWRASDQAEDLNTVANPPAGFTFYTANAVTLDGQFIAGFCDTPLHWEAYIWSAATGLKTLGNIDTESYKPPTGNIAPSPTPIYTEAFAVSENGRAAVGRNWPGWSSRTFIWTVESGPQTIAQALDHAGIFDAPWDTGLTFGNYTTDISADGTLIVGTMDRSSVGPRAFLLDLRNIKIIQTASGSQLTWPDGFKLQQTTGLDLNSWHDVSGAASPLPISPTGPGSFYRIVPLP